MKKIVVKKKTDYTVISNVFLRDEKLSLKSKGLLAYVLSLPNDWVLYVTELSNHHKDGTSAIYSAFKELIEHGYVRRKRERIDGNLIKKIQMKKIQMKKIQMKKIKHY